MVSRTLSFLLLVLSTLASVGSAFAPIVPVAAEVNVVGVAAPTLMTSVASTTINNNNMNPLLQQGVQNFVSLGPESSLETSTMTLSLKDRPPPPTKEELAAKKRNFNLWFWGGGFVAPFVATVYYFGPKFWTK
mmetsp:Transcript_116756/g.326627  ORF Transcript_116756/g.326627 Transcript_116756/m.326627 type:complete len:133 (-) Transcript_116756:101-499(-)